MITEVLLEKIKKSQGYTYFFGKHKKADSYPSLAPEIISIDRLLASTDEIDLVADRNTLNTSLNETLLLLLFTRYHGAKLVSCEDSKKENIHALEYLIKKKVDSLNQYAGKNAIFQFDPKTIYSIRKMEDLRFAADEFLPISFKKDGIYMIPPYGRGAPDKLRNMNCKIIFS